MQTHPHSPTRDTPRSLKLHRSIGGPAQAPPVLALHGITGSQRYWLPRLLPLSRNYRLIVPDLPGFGLSPKPFTDYTPEFFIEALIGLLDQERIEGPVRLLGHSLGALLSLEFAACYPDRVESLTLLNVPRHSDAQRAHELWFRGSASYRNLLMANSLADNWAQVRRTGWKLTARYMKRLPWAVVADCRRFTFRSLTSTLEHCLLDYHVDQVLERVPPVSIRIIHGDVDQVAMLEDALGFPGLPPHPTLQVIEGAGHHPFHTHTDLCLELIRAHLQGDSPYTAGTARVRVVEPAAAPSGESGA